MTDFLDILARDAKNTVQEGYYSSLTPSRAVTASFRAAILNTKTSAVIAEVKGASPSRGVIRQNFVPEEIAGSMVRGGAVGISVLTEPKHFCGSLDNIAKVRQFVKVPVLMKDIVVSPIQLEAASKVGANAVLLIQTIFDREYCQLGIDEMITKAHSKNLEVLLESHNEAEFVKAVNTEADLVGINNRNLATLEVDLNVTKNVLAKCSNNGKVVVSESGIRGTIDLRFLRDCGANAFLIGSTVMLADNVEEKVSELVNA
jgi:indole-3-glycerol phosphate synthase